MNENITTISLGFVNAYLLKAADGFALVDTGMPFQYAQLETALKENGALPDKLKLIIITHADMDHIGCADSLRKKYGCKIAIHPGDSEALEKGLRYKRHARTFNAKLMMLLFGLKRLFSKKAEPVKFKADILLSDKADLSVYGINATVLHVPGHTKGSIAILTKEGDLISGDTVVNQGGGPNTAIFIENDRELGDSVARLSKLQLRKIYPGHGAPFDAKNWK
jgi:glyoxylase-like metal-dependent hydrolase (beta-lactamase superfamily II)